ncbi:unnamed protein product [Leptosia nina]|uniref:Uncharacterized protein n=1 Tax=Leptosia nina TaxID=320188 RepID=A0AAV1JUD2_9NEOP
MQCFICVVYVMTICSAHPPKDREPSVPQRRSLFHDVIESLRIRAQLPEVFSDDENNLGQSYEKFTFENDLQQPNDVNFVPRRNDRLEMPTLKYRFPKNLDLNDTIAELPKEEIVLYINAPEDSDTTTIKPKKTKRPRPVIKNKVKTKEAEELEQKPVPNSMSGQSQIGNRETQTVVKPTVIVNFRGSVSNRESDIRLERRKNNNTLNDVTPQNIFNINQEIKLERADPGLSSTGDPKRTPNAVRQNIKIEADGKVEEDMMMCETNSWKDGKSRDGRHLLQILLSV